VQPKRRNRSAHSSVATRATRSARNGSTATGEISPALLAKFEKLGSRWKSLLPRLASSSTRRHAPAKTKAKRRS
jgi:hypothetical protein